MRYHTGNANNAKALARILACNVVCSHEALTVGQGYSSFAVHCGVVLLLY